MYCTKTLFYNLYSRWKEVHPDDYKNRGLFMFLFNLEQREHGIGVKTGDIQKVRAFVFLLGTIVRDEKIRSRLCDKKSIEESYFPTKTIDGRDVKHKYYTFVLTKDLLAHLCVLFNLKFKANDIINEIDKTQKLRFGVDVTEDELQEYEDSQECKESQSDTETQDDEGSQEDEEKKKLLGKNSISFTYQNEPAKNRFVTPLEGKSKSDGHVSFMQLFNNSGSDLLKKNKIKPIFGSFSLK